VQSISGIRTVTAFNMKAPLMALYAEALDRPERLGIISGTT
jgi:hypothetical protein